MLIPTLSCRLLMPRLNICCRWIVSRCFLLQNSPVKHIVIWMTKCSKQNTKQLPQVHVVSCLLKTQSSAVVQIHCKLCRKTLQNTHHDFPQYQPSSQWWFLSAAAKPWRYVHSLLWLSFITMPHASLFFQLQFASVHPVNRSFYITQTVL